MKQLTKVLSEQTTFWLDEICKIENYFIEEINQRKSCSKKLSKYAAAFDYMEKILIFLSATTGGVYICSFTSASFTLIFSLTTRITKNLLNITRKKKSTIKFLCWLKVNSIALKH